MRRINCLVIQEAGQNLCTGGAGMALGNNLSVNQSVFIDIALSLNNHYLKTLSQNINKDRDL